jgi:hypothetical protein
LISLSVLFLSASLRNEKKRIGIEEERKEKRKGKKREGRKFTDQTVNKFHNGFKRNRRDFFF